MSAGRQLGIALGAVGVVALGSGLFAAFVPPRSAVVAWLTLVAASTPVLIAAGVLLSRAPLEERHWRVAVLGGALLLRLGALAAPVSLSDDVHRYVWDGALLLDGHDPFASRPVEVAHLPGLGDEALSRLNSPRYYSVYPPLAQASFAAAVGLERAIGVDSTLALRVVYVLADLLAVWALLGLVTRLGARHAPRRGWALVYAWHPLAFWEVAGGGHTEALMLPFVLWALAAALDARPRRAGILLGLAAGAKLTALVVAPVLLVHLARVLGWRRALPFALLAVALPAALFLPFASATLIPHVAESLALYQQTFSFNAPIYYGARYLLGYREGLTASVDSIVGPLLTVATIAGLGALAHAQDGSARRLVRGLAYAYAGYLLLSRVMHPWYLLAPLALGALAESRALALLALLALASYLRYDPLGAESPLVLALQLVPVVALATCERGPRGARPSRP